LQKSLMFLTLAVIVTGCRQKGSILVEADDQRARVAIAAVESFHKDLKEERYSEVCGRSTATAFKGSSDLPCIPFLTFVHENLGRPLDARRTNLPIREDGAESEPVRVGLDYASEYERGSAKEHFEFRIAGQTATLISYSVESEAFHSRETPR